MSNATDADELAAARERMRKKRKDPEFRKKERARFRALWALAHEYPTRFRELMDEEMKR